MVRDHSHKTNLPKDHRPSVVTEINTAASCKSGLTWSIQCTLLTLFKTGNLPLLNTMDEPGGHGANWNKLDSEGQILHDFTHMQFLRYWNPQIQRVWWLAGTEGNREVGRCSSMRINLTEARCTDSGDTLYNRVPEVHNTGYALKCGREGRYHVNCSHHHQQHQ